MTSELNAPATTRAPQLEPALGEPASRGTRLAARRPGPHDGRSSHALQCPTANAGAPPRAHAEAAFRAVLEVVSKRRTFNQIRQLLDPAIRDAAAMLIAARVSANKAANLGSVHVQPVSADVAEVFGTYSRGDRVFALAARLTRTDGRWIITALAMP